MRSRILSLGALLLALVTSPSAARDVVGERGEAAYEDGEPRLEALLLVDPDRAGSDPLRAGVLLTPDPGWHVYWKNPGDAGLATRVIWHGGEASPLRWPAPSAFASEQGVSFGYEGSVLLASEIRMAAGAETLGVDVDAVVCRDACIPARLSLERRVAAPYSGEALDAVRRLFALHDASLPHEARAFGVGVEASAAEAEQGPRVRIEVRSCSDRGADAPCARLAAPALGQAFFPASQALRVLDVSATADGVGVLLAREPGADVSGVLTLRGGDGRFHAVEISLPGSALAASVTPARVLAMLALALLGGVLLNAMPCVLPVLALKVFALVELATRQRREALAQGLAYAAGIEASMLALAAAVLGLRLAGHEVGWGFQLQSPGFVAVLAALCVTFALNLFGVFEIGFVPARLAGVGAESSGVRRSFFEGLLAVALATPCSAPFLGTAVGFAFAGDGMGVVSIFLVIGLGLALPFLVISAIPGAARWLPRPGPWMAELRRHLGFALLATTVWLVWVLARSAGADAAALLLALLLVLALALHWLGRSEERPALRAVLVATGLALVVAAPGLVVSRPSPRAHESGVEETRWSPEALERLRAEGRPVLVVFSADWCVTCKWNERTVLGRAAVRDALSRGGWAVLEADWTKRDETIRRELARFGKAGVPLTLVYTPGAAEPQVMPELLSVEALLGALEGGERGHAQASRSADASNVQPGREKESL